MEKLHLCSWEQDLGREGQAREERRDREEPGVREHQGRNGRRTEIEWRAGSGREDRTMGTVARVQGKVCRSGEQRSRGQVLGDEPRQLSKGQALRGFLLSK